jgi:hypothetical protein
LHIVVNPYPKRIFKTLATVNLCFNVLVCFCQASTAHGASIIDWLMSGETYGVESYSPDKDQGSFEDPVLPPWWTILDDHFQQDKKLNVFNFIPNKEDGIRPLNPPARIPPLYISPKIEGEGDWEWRQMPRDKRGIPLGYKTIYRPSPEFPNAVVYMVMLDIKRLSMRLYLGSQEPNGSESTSVIEPELQENLIAVTNGLWKIRHSGGGGVIFRGNLLKELIPGMATILNFRDGSFDIVDWLPSIPLDPVSSARQLKHLIVDNSKVVTTITKNGAALDSEIGLGSLLNEDQPTIEYNWGYNSERAPNFTSGQYWFIATRSAFGIRPDGNLVFAVGHHISTKELAGAMVLAGCVRAMHGDANPANCFANFYFHDTDKKLMEVEKLSPRQDDSISSRFIGKSSPSDFFAFLLR